MYNPELFFLFNTKPVNTYSKLSRPTLDGYTSIVNEVYTPNPIKEQPESKPTQSDTSNNFVNSMLIGAITNNGVLGGILGGDMLGGIVGDMMNGND